MIFGGESPLFTRASAGDVEAQRDVLVRTVQMLNDPRFASPGDQVMILHVAELWARIVATHGQDDDQFALVNLLGHIATRCDASGDVAATNYHAEALAILYRLAERRADGADELIARIVPHLSAAVTEQAAHFAAGPDKARSH